MMLSAMMRLPPVRRVIMPKRGVWRQPSNRQRTSAILVAAVPDQGEEVARSRQGLFDAIEVVGVQRETKRARVVVDMSRSAEANAHNHTGDGGLVQNIARCHVGDADAVFAGNLAQRDEQVLKTFPSTPRVDHPLVLLERGGIELGADRFGRT